MSQGRARAAAAMLGALLPLAVPARANPSLSEDFRNMSGWLNHELVEGLAFNAGSTFDPPREVKGYHLQPDVSLGVGRIPFDKGKFPALTTQALNDFGGQNLFPNSVLFPNLAVHLRMGLPWRGDAYVRFADATTPAGYKISPTMTAAVQTNSYGFGLRQHFFGREPDEPTLTVGAHYNHVKGRTRLKGKFQVDTSGFTADQDFTGAIDWNLSSYGLTAVVSQTFERWTPFAGLGYNYAVGSARTALDMKSETFLVADVHGESSDRPEQNQGRWIMGVEYGRPSWSLFANAELKAIGEQQYKTYIVQFGAALPFEIGGKFLFHRRGGPQDAPRGRSRIVVDDEPAPKPRPERAAPAPKPAKGEKAPPDMIFLQ